MKIAVLSIHHESDTFNPILTGMKDIRILEGEEMLKQHSRTSCRGIIDALQKEEVEVVPILKAYAVPNGVWRKEDYVGIRDSAMAILKENLPVDAIALALHGSMRVEKIGKAEDDLIEAIRRICPDVPVSASLDMHASLSGTMLESIDVLYGYRTAPHVDTYETGYRSAELLLDILKGRRYYCAAVSIPMLIAGEKSETSTEPMSSLIHLLEESDCRDGIVATSFLLGFPWADCRDNTASSLVVAESQEKAEEMAILLARAFWERRRDFTFCAEALWVEETVAKAEEYLRRKETPLVISDSGDNPTAGSSQDNTNLLKRIMESGYLTSLDPPLVYNAIYDEQFFKEAEKLGEGAWIVKELGACYDRRSSIPVHIEGRIQKITFSEKIRSKVASVFSHGVLVIVTERHVPCYEISVLEDLGIDVERVKCLVVKLGYLEPDLKKLAGKEILCLSRGATAEDFSLLDYRNISRPVYPLDDMQDDIEFNFIV